MHPAVPDEQSINTNRGSSHNQQPLRSRRSRRRTRRARTRRKGCRAVGGTIDEGRTLVEGKFPFIFGPGNGSESTAERERQRGNVRHDVTGCIRRHARARACVYVCMPCPPGISGTGSILHHEIGVKRIPWNSELRACESAANTGWSRSAQFRPIQEKKRTKKNLPRKPLPQACLIMV